LVSHHNTKFFVGTTFVSPLHTTTTWPLKEKKLKGEKIKSEQAEDTVQETRRGE